MQNVTYVDVKLIFDVVDTKVHQIQFILLIQCFATSIIGV